MALLLVTIIGTFLGTITALEAKAWMPYLSAYLVRATIARFPDRLGEGTRSRWAEEIEADLASYEDRPIGGVLFALRLRVKGGRELAAQLALQATLAADSRTSREGDAAPDSSLAEAIAALQLDLGASARVLYLTLLAYIKKAAAADVNTRERYLEELRASMATPVVRKTINRIGPPDLSDIDGLRLAVLLGQLREEVAMWSGRE